MRRAAALTNAASLWLFFLLATLGALPACQNRPADPCAADDPAIARRDVGPVPIARFDQQFAQLRTPAEISAFAEQHPLFARQYLLRPQYPSAEAFTSQLTQLVTNPGFQKLNQEAAQAFGDLATERAQLRGAFQHIAHYFPGFRPPQVVAFVSGLSQDVFVNDSLLVLGLDFFIGPQATYKPPAPRYIQRRFAPAYLVPAAVLPMANKYLQQDPTDKTLLNQLVQYGKSYYFLEKMLPCVPDSLKIGFTTRELATVAYNEQRIWSHFLERKLLYNTLPFVQQKYTGERPSVGEIGKECPGRIGQWVGWQIVRAYMAENPAVTLPQLMLEQNAQKILDGSHYKPRKRERRQ